MSDKNQIFKARFTIADLRHQCNHSEVFTTALTKGETLEHFILKLLGYSFLSYDDAACLNNQFNKFMPDVSIKALDEHYKKWMCVDSADLHRLLKIAKTVDELIILTIAHSPWLCEVKPRLSLLPNSHFIEIDKQFIDKLESNLTRNLYWNITIDQNSVSISDEAHYYQTTEFVWS